jgi:predicted PurR-regulated permease PerM
LNTVAIFIGVLFWGWLWGLVGVLIAVPLLVAVKRCCDHLPSWSTLGEFLSLTPPKSEVEAEQEQPDLNLVAKT